MVGTGDNLRIRVLDLGLIARASLMLRVALLAVVMHGLAARGHAFDKYALIGYSPTTGKALAIKESIIVDRSAAAIKQSLGNNANVTWARNSWVALSIGRNGAWGTGTGESEEDAAQAANDKCPGGTCRFTAFSGRDYYKFEGTREVFWYSDPGAISNQPRA